MVRGKGRGGAYVNDELMTVRSIANVEFNRSGKLSISIGGNRCAGREAVSAIGQSTWRQEARRTSIRGNIFYRSKLQCYTMSSH